MCETQGVENSGKNTSSSSPQAFNQAKMQANNNENATNAGRRRGERAENADNDAAIYLPAGARTPTRPPPTVSLSNEQLVLLLAQVQEAREATPTSPAPRAVAYGAVNWRDMALLDVAKPGEVDKWFVNFEVKLKAARVPEEVWVEKFEECPCVPQAVKVVVGGEEDASYANIRKRVLKEFGPKLPVGYFRQRITHVKGTTREVVRKELEELLQLYNRACRDAGIAEYTKADLLYPFIGAFPEKVSADLMRDLGLVASLPDPFEQLFFRAPTELTSPGALLAAVEDTPAPITQPPVAAPDTATIAAIVAQTVDKMDRRRNNYQAPPQRRNDPMVRRQAPPKRQMRICEGCGGTCLRPQECPARGKTCYHCGGMNYMAHVCRKKLAGFPRTTPLRPQQQPVNVHYSTNEPRRVFRNNYLGVAAVVRTLEAAPALTVALRLGDNMHEALVDTGATLSFVRGTLPVASSGPSERISLEVALATGEVRHLKTAVRLPFSLGSASGDHLFISVSPLAYEVVLGNDFLARHQVRPLPESEAVTLADGTFLPRLPRRGARLCVLATPNPNILEGVQLGPKLTPEQRDAILRVLLPEYFSSDAKPFGRTDVVVHGIDTGDARPIHQKLRPTSPQERDIVRIEIDKMLASGAIRPSQSPWASPIVLVKKKDGTTRFCIDFRRLNAITARDEHPLPRISDMIETLRGARYFTTLDAASGYWQIGMAQEAIPKTAFICTEGLFEWLVMPFGLCNAPATYQRSMHYILAGLLWTKVLVYIDDILIFSETFEDHLETLREVLRRMHNAGFLLKMKKCEFGKDDVEYLGYRVGATGLKMDPKKTAKIEHFPTPTNARSVKSFLGLAGYYRRFVKGFSSLAAPLHDLTKLGTPFVWGAREKNAFTTIKTALLREAILPFPDFDKPFVVDCDASEIGMGAVLSQVIEGNERPLVMESRLLTAAERKWHIREKEALAIIYALEKFRHFILGRQFTVRSDHSSLEWLMQAKTGRLCRWAIRMAEFQPFTIVHRSGKMHSNVDALTRDFADSEGFPENAFLGSMWVPPTVPWCSLSAIREAQRTDSQCQRLRQLRRGVTRDNILGFGRKDQWRPLLPEALVEKTTLDLHQHPLGGHMGPRKMLSMLQQHFVIPRGITPVRRALDGCLACLQRKPSLQKHGKLAAKPPSRPWKTVAMDFAGPYPSSASGSRYVLVFVDHFTKWIELVATHDQLAITVVRAFYKEVICRHGCPQNLLSDRGPQFRSDLVDSLCRHFGIKKLFSSAYYPQGDGFAERFMRTMNNSLAALCREDPTHWDDYLPGIAFAYNNSAHAATKLSPFELNTGRVASLPGGVAHARAKEFANAPEYLRKLRNIITNCHERARKAVQGYWEAAKAAYDKRRREIRLKTGDWVLVRLSDYERGQFPSLKLAPRWSEPSKVTRCLTNGVTFDVERGTGKVETVHASRLLPLRGDFWREVTSKEAAPAAQVVIREMDDDEHWTTPGGVVYLPRSVPHVATPAVHVVPPESPQERGSEQLRRTRMTTEQASAPRTLPVRPTEDSMRPIEDQRPPSPKAREPYYHHTSRELYDVERIVGYRDLPGRPRECRREYRVKWLDYPDSENTWEPEYELLWQSRDKIEEYWNSRTGRPS